MPELSHRLLGVVIIILPGLGQRVGLVDEEERMLLKELVDQRRGLADVAALELCAGNLEAAFASEARFQ